MAKGTSSSKSGTKKPIWKGIQKKVSTSTSTKQSKEPISIPSQESRRTSQEDQLKHDASSDEEEFKDAVGQEDDHFQDEQQYQEEERNNDIIQVDHASEEKKVETRMSLILPVLQNHGYHSSEDDDEDDDNESLKDPNEMYLQQQQKQQYSAADHFIAEIEALEVGSSAPTVVKESKEEEAPPEVEEKVVFEPEKPATYEPIPNQRTYKRASSPTAVIETPTSNISIPPSIVSQEEEEEEKKPTMQDIQNEIMKSAAAVKAAAKAASPTNTESPVVDENATDAQSSNQEVDTTATDLDSGISISQTVRSSSSSTNHLAAILSAVEESTKDVTSRTKELKPEDYERANHSREFEYSIEDPVDLDTFRENVIAIQAIKEIPANHLKPREQEAADEPVREGMRLLFDNKFMKAKSVFQTKASIDPLYAFGLGAMAFIKAIMTYHDSDIEIAMNALATAYTIAKTQIDNTSFKKPFKDTISTYLSTFLSFNPNTGLPPNPPTMPPSSGGIASPNAFIPNGVLRAHVIKAECCLLISVLQMTQESVVGYLKCGLNLRRAYHSYSIVWQEYKRMGQEYTKYMDSDTVSAIQFGIGAVHLILSSMPPKILKIFSVLGWKSDKQLGFALLKLCLEGRGIRAPFASLTLLAHYSILTSFAPQLYSNDMMTPAIECLLDAQSCHPNSCFFLFFAARIARVARNLTLSTQSFTYASESSRGEWAEVALKQMSDYEIGFNLALALDWSKASTYFDHLSKEKYWSTAFSQYFVGACYEMMGQRTEAILAFAQVPNEGKTYIDAYVQKKVAFFQKSGYQDMDFSLPGLEIMLVLNAFEYMENSNLEQCLELVQHTLELIYEREKVEYNIRLRELVPVTNPPDYYDQRAILLLIKASILNSLGRYDETIAHLNWILDHKDCFKEETWVIPFTYWESGVTSWGLGNFIKSRKLWQLAMTCTKYDFEYRMAVRLSLALSKCDEEGIPHMVDKDIIKGGGGSGSGGGGTTTHGRKRMPIINNSVASNSSILTPSSSSV